MLYYLGIALISAATILLELVLLRLFAVQQFYHFAFMAVSLALLGAGASGSILSVTTRRASPSTLCIAFSLTTVTAYLIINYLPFDSYAIAWDRRQIAYLALYFLAAAVPYLFSGLLVGAELIRAGSGHKPSGGSHRVYGANLIGSAVGGLASLPVIAIFGGEGALLFAAIIGVMAGAFLSISDPAERCSGKSRARFAVMVVLFLVGLTTLIARPAWMAQRLSPYKTLAILSETLDARHTLTEWDATARVDVVESGTIHVMPGLSLLAPISVPEQAALLLDGDSLMPLTRLDPASEQATQLAAQLPISLIYLLRPEAKTLILNSGTGLDVMLALASGASDVTAVEQNSLVLDVLAEQYSDLTHDLVQDPGVTVINQSSRVFTRAAGKDNEKYTVILLSLTDPHRPVTSGAYSLTEDYTYTVEAFGDYLQLLEPDGLLVVTRWLQSPPSESARVFGGLAAALENAGLEPSEHLAAFRTLRTMTIIAKTIPFSDSEIAATRAFLDRLNFDAVSFRGLEAAELNRYNVLDEPEYHNLFQAILQDPDRLVQDYRFDIRPVTDDRPFLFHFFKWRQTPEILATLGYNWQPFGGSGYFVLVALLIVVSLAAAVLITGPLLLLRGRLQVKRPPGISLWRLRVLVYFGALGLAYLFVEMPLAQRFILVLDKPVTALAVVLFAILLFSGLGSLTAYRWSLRRGLLLLALLAAFYPFALRPLMEAALSLPALARIGATILMIAPLGYLMGLPFALGLKLLEQYEPSLVPWAWAINGTFSVISSVLAVMLALTFGLSAVLWLGAAAYGLALVALWGLAGRDIRPSPEPINSLLV